jgi:enamine deaminase RidA (YjgF/YER057c/UK114 family)
MTGTTTEKTVRQRLAELGVAPCAALQVPGGAVYPFVWLRRRGTRAIVSGHLPLEADGSLARPLGKLGEDLGREDGAAAARKVALAMLGTLERELGDLEKISAWVRVLGFVNAAPGFTQLPAVVNGFSELIVAVFGRERGSHARSAVGVAELPFGVPVEVEAELEISE